MAQIAKRATSSTRARREAAAVGHALRLQFGRAIREAREKAGLLQSDVAARMKVQQSYISKLEQGGVPGVTLDRLVELAAAVELELTIQVHPRVRLTEPKSGQ